MKGLKIFGGLIAVLIIGLIILTLFIDGIVKSAIEENSSELLQTEVTVSSVNISVFDGSGVIRGFVVENPEGFSDEPAIEIEETQIKVNLTTLLSDLVVIENINIKNPELFFEQRGLGANLQRLNDNMDLAEDAGETALVINHLLIENGIVKVSSTIERERTAEASIEQFELTGIGREGSNTVKQSVRQILEPLIEQAIQEAVTGGLMEQLENKVRDLLNGNEEE